MNRVISYGKFSSLLVGLCSFAFVLLLVIIVIVFYHQYNRKRTKKFNNKIITKLEMKNNETNDLHDNQSNNGKKSLFSCQHTTQVLVHDNTKRSSSKFNSSQPLECERLSELPAWDIPPMIDVVLTSNPECSPVNDDKMEDRHDLWEDAKYVSLSEASTLAVIPEQSTNNLIYKDSLSVWRNIEDYGRKLYKTSQNFMFNNDGRPASEISTTSDSSSVVTVVENPIIETRSQ